PISRRLILPTGKVGVAVDSIKAGSMGMVKVEGEYWKAKALEDISEGDSIIVVDFDGLSVTVKRADHG
ncbi:MAG: NfeD family protein, partial [Thermocladium sp.]